MSKTGWSNKLDNSILIRNGVLLTLADEAAVVQGDILIRGSRIAEISPRISAKAAVEIDATGQVVMPGFIQTHIHLCQTLFRNLANDLDLLDWLRKRIWPLEAAHTRESMAASARLGLLELIRSGTTTILDMGSVRFSDILLQEAQKVGIRAFIGITLMEEGEGVPPELKIPPAESLQQFKELAETWNRSPDARQTVHLAPRFALSCRPETFQQAAELARQYGTLVHTHASENRKEVDLVRRQSGLGNVAYYHRLGITGDRLCLAHCIWLDAEEVDILAETGTRVLHCPSANLKLGSGIADIPAYLKKGILCSLGADGAPCNNNLNIFQEMRLAGLIQKPRYGPATLPAKVLVRMATIQGARTLHIDKTAGTLQPGMSADLILVDLSQPETEPSLSWDEDALCAQLVYATPASSVRTVIASGRLLMHERKVLVLDETETVARAREELRYLLQRAQLT